MQTIDFFHLHPRRVRRPHKCANQCRRGLLTSPAHAAYLARIAAQLAPRPPDPSADRLTELERQELLAEVDAHARLRPPPTEAETEAAEQELIRREEMYRLGLLP
jgi:hypothetical protein